MLATVMSGVIRTTFVTRTTAATIAIGIISNNPISTFFIGVSYFFSAAKNLSSAARNIRNVQ